MILEQVVLLLNDGKRLNIPQIANQIPELSGRENAIEILRLLLRLDQRFDHDGDLWYSINKETDPRSRVVDATLQYFKEQNPHGELLEHLITAISEITGEDRQIVKEIILKDFQSVQNGKMILNRKKE